MNDFLLSLLSVRKRLRYGGRLSIESMTLAGKAVIKMEVRWFIGLNLHTFYKFYTLSELLDVQIDCVGEFITYANQDIEKKLSDSGKKEGEIA
jgi:hypothetical protein